MINVDEKEIIKGKGPESGVILTVDEFEELDDAYKEKLAEAEEAEAASKDADKRLEALNAEKSEKEASIAALQADLKELEDTMEDLNVMLDQEERLNKALMEVKEGAK